MRPRALKEIEMGHFRCLALFLTLGIGVPAAAQVEPLRFTASSSWGMPFGEIQADRITGGIVFDMAAAIG